VRGSSSPSAYRAWRAHGVPTVKGIEALVGVVNVKTSQTFTVRCASSPARIGRSRTSEVWLDHRAVARHHAELLFNAHGIYFRNLAWIRKTFVDGLRIRRGVSVELDETAVVLVGPFKIEVCLRRLEG